LPNAHELDTPWQAIRRLVDSASSGELIIASDAIEIHVYVLDGRLAWATSSTARNEFLRRLVEDHGIANDTLREVIEECRRTRGRLGETLIAWGVATADQIRDALRAQIEHALVAAAAHRGARCLFLPRRLKYAMELTFALADLDLDAASAVRTSDTAHKVVTTVLDGVPDALWVEVIDQGEIVAHAVRGAVRPTAAVADLQRLLGDLELEALTLRSTAHGAVLGQRLPGAAAAVWCAVGGGAQLGVTSAVLASAVGAQAVAATAPPTDEPWHEIADPGVPFGPSVFAGATRTRDELLAGFALGAEGGPTGVWRGGVAVEVHAAWARRLTPALGAAIRDAFCRSVGSLLYEHVSVRAVIGNTAYYGTQVQHGPIAVWLVLRPWASQGLGWALLQTVARQVGGEA